MATDTAETLAALAAALGALREAREFIDDIVPGWYLPKQRMLAEIDAALLPLSRTSRRDELI
jgi:hypothetical protein